MAEDKKNKEQEVSEEEDNGGSQTISLFLAIGFIISALVVGLIIGYFVAPRGVGVPGTNQTGQQSAPALSPDQVQSGQLPPGHPQLPATGTAGESSQTTTSTPSGTPTEPAQ